MHVLETSDQELAVDAGLVKNGILEDLSIGFFITPFKEVASIETQEPRVVVLVDQTILLVHRDATVGHDVSVKLIRSGYVLAAMR